MSVNSIQVRNICHYDEEIGNDVGLFPQLGRVYLGALVDNDPYWNLTPRQFAEAIYGVEGSSFQDTTSRFFETEWSQMLDRYSAAMVSELGWFSTHFKYKAKKAEKRIRDNFISALEVEIQLLFNNYLSYENADNLLTGIIWETFNNIYAEEYTAMREDTDSMLHIAQSFYKPFFRRYSILIAFWSAHGVFTTINNLIFVAISNAIRLVGWTGGAAIPRIIRWTTGPVVGASAEIAVIQVTAKAVYHLTVFLEWLKAHYSNITRIIGRIYNAIPLFAIGTTLGRVGGGALGILASGAFWIIEFITGQHGFFSTNGAHDSTKMFLQSVRYIRQSAFVKYGVAAIRAGKFVARHGGDIRGAFRVWTESGGLTVFGEIMLVNVFVGLFLATLYAAINNISDILDEVDEEDIISVSDLDVDDESIADLVLVAEREVQRIVPQIESVYNKLTADDGPKNELIRMFTTFIEAQNEDARSLYAPEIGNLVNELQRIRNEISGIQSSIDAQIVDDVKDKLTAIVDDTINQVDVSRLSAATFSGADTGTDGGLTFATGFDVEASSTFGEYGVDPIDVFQIMQPQIENLLEGKTEEELNEMTDEEIINVLDQAYAATDFSEYVDSLAAEYIATHITFEFEDPSGEYKEEVAGAEEDMQDPDSFVTAISGAMGLYDDFEDFENGNVGELYNAHIQMLETGIDGLTGDVKTELEELKAFYVDMYYYYQVITNDPNRPQSMWEGSNIQMIEERYGIEGE